MKWSAGLLLMIATAVASDAPLAHSANAETTKTNVIARTGDKINGPLPAGDTIFVVALPPVHSERFIFVNDNWTARGHFEIAIAKKNLPADSPDWTTVNGAVPFDHKRCFTVSLLGVEARYIRLRFHVQNNLVASLNL